MEIDKIKININRWFKEDKGGFGAFLILVIMGLAFYAFQRKEPVANYELPVAETQELTTTRPVSDRNRFTQSAFSDTVNRETEADITDSTLVALEKEKAKVKARTASVKAKPKARPKPARKRISNEDLVRSKLRAGMSVRQIAKATGLEKKYIREIKKKKSCNCPG